LEKGVIKYHIFSLKSSDAFLKYADLKKAYAAMLPAEKEEVVDEKVVVEEVAVV
jgi:hypothetical protein